MTKRVKIGSRSIGGGNPILIQSMTNTKTRDAEATVSQILALERAGCEIVRVSVPDEESAAALPEIKARISVPLVADIHFDYRLALLSIENGADKLRINPGNIGKKGNVESVARVAAERGLPIRIGVNSGSLEREILDKYGGVTARGLFESALREIRVLESVNFDNIVVSIKASDVMTSLRAYELIAEAVDYPLHIGITEAGTVYSGAIKSAAGLGAILSRGLGDTIRVSLTGDPVEEVKCGREILKAMGLREFGAALVSCPTCARTEIDLIALANAVERELEGISAPIRVAVMGCAVNGPGEARDADLGIAGGKGEGLLFRKGEIVRRVPEGELLSALVRELEAYKASGSHQELGGGKRF